MVNRVGVWIEHFTVLIMMLMIKTWWYRGCICIANWALSSVSANNYILYNKQTSFGDDFWQFIFLWCRWSELSSGLPAVYTIFLYLTWRHKYNTLETFLTQLQKESAEKVLLHLNIGEEGGNIFILENELALGAAFFVFKQLTICYPFSSENFYSIFFWEDFLFLNVLYI